jgi:hypothetical protein
LAADRCETKTKMALLLRALRLFFLVLIGALLTPLAGYIGALAIPNLIPVWLAGLVLMFGTKTGLNAVLILFIFPALYGAKWIWPVTCVIFPLVGLLLRRSTARTPWLFLAIGCVGGAAIVYALVEFRLYLPAGLRVGLFNKINLTTFMLAGSVAGAALGALYGYILWRTDRWWSVPGTRHADQTLR